MVKVLIADDERFERELLLEIVEERFPRQVQTRTAENGRKGGIQSPDLLHGHHADHLGLGQTKMPGEQVVGGRLVVTGGLVAGPVVFSAIDLSCLKSRIYTAVSSGEKETFQKNVLETTWSRFPEESQNLIQRILSS